MIQNSLRLSFQSIYLYKSKELSQRSLFRRIIPRFYYVPPNIDNTQQKKKNETNRLSIALRGPVSFTSLGLCVVAMVGIVIYYNIEKDKRIETTSSEVVHFGKPLLGGPWTLVDHNGIPKTDAFYRGKFMLLYFGFTHCPDICPSELVKVHKILLAAEKRKIIPEIKPIFISVDPNRDTIGQLRHYRKDFDPNIDFFTGTPDQIAEVTRSYRVYFSKANENENDDTDYLVDHSIVLYLIGPDGEFLDFFTQRMQVSDIVDKIENHAKSFKSTMKSSQSS